jgi:hypothetical protein
VAWRRTPVKPAIRWVAWATLVGGWAWKSALIAAPWESKAEGGPGRASATTAAKPPDAKAVTNFRTVLGLTWANSAASARVRPCPRKYTALTRRLMASVLWETRASSSGCNCSGLNRARTLAASLPKKGDPAERSVARPVLTHRVLSPNFFSQLLRASGIYCRMKLRRCAELCDLGEKSKKKREREVGSPRRP